MSELEDLMRWSFYLDFGTTPEQYFGLNQPKKETVLLMETQCRNEEIKTSLFQLTAKEMLSQFKSQLLEVARRQNIDGRAIAGAITWEYEVNWKGRWSDKLQVHWPTDDMGIGWGSIHNHAAQAVRPGLSAQDLVCKRLNAESALKMVGEIMARFANLYYQTSQGIWIHDSPPALAYFFNTGEPKVKESATQRKLSVCRIGQTVPLNVTVNPMAAWVKNNLSRFAEFKTTPSMPSTCYQKAVAA